MRKPMLTGRSFFDFGMGRRFGADRSTSPARVAPSRMGTTVPDPRDSFRPSWGGIDAATVVTINPNVLERNYACADLSPMPHIIGSRITSVEFAQPNFAATALRTLLF